MNRIKSKRNKEIEELFDDGWGLSEIAKRFGIARERARQIVKSRKENRKKFRQLSKIKEQGGF
jgi:Mor family transcriptional regulator